MLILGFETSIIKYYLLKLTFLQKVKSLLNIALEFPIFIKNDKNN